MAKRESIDHPTYERVLAAVRAAWDEGSPIASNPEKLAAIAIRRWHSRDRRGVARDDRAHRIDDLAKGLIEQMERDRSLVGALTADYRYVAEKIASVL